MISVGYWHGPHSQVEISKAKSECYITMSPQTSMRCSTFLSQEIPTALSIDKGMIFNKKLGLIMPINFT